MCTYKDGIEFKFYLNNGFQIRVYDYNANFKVDKGDTILPSEASKDFNLSQLLEQVGKDMFPKYFQDKYSRTK